MAQTRMTQDAQGERPSLDALNQTIEGLETRLAAMMENRHPARRPAPAPQPQDLRERFTRQRLPTEPSAMPTDDEFNDIAAALKDLRAAVRKDFTDSLRDELAGLHGMLLHINRQTDTQDVDDQTRGELLRISEGVDWLLSNAAADTNEPLMAEFEHLQTLLRGLAGAESIDRLETRFDNLEQHLAPFDPARLDDDLATLASGLNDIRHHLDASQTDRSLNEIETRLTALAQAMEVLCSRIPASSKKLDGQMGTLERRIEDIDRNIELIGRRQGEVRKDPAIERLEKRFSELSNAVAAVDWQMRDQSTKQTTLLENLEKMARRIEDHGADDGHIKLEARLDKLANAVNNIAPGIDQTLGSALGQAVSELSGRIEKIDMSGAERRLGDKLETIENHVADDGTIRLEGQLAKLSNAVNNIAPGIDRQALGEAVAALSDKIEQIDVPGTERRLNNKIDNIAPGLDRQALDEAISELSSKIGQLDIAGAERRLAEKVDNAAHGHFSEQDRRTLEQQFDRLSALVESNGRGLEPNDLEEAVRRITETISRIDLQSSERRIATKLDMLQRGQPDDSNAVRDELKRLARVIENTKPGIAPDALEAAVSKINGNIASIDVASAERRLSTQITEMQSHIAAPELHEKINAIDPAAFEKRLTARIEALDLSGTEERLSRKLADLQNSGANQTFEAQLSELANRFEETRRDMSAPALQKLERQIAELTALVGKPNSDLPVQELEQRIAAHIEALDLPGTEERLSRKIADLQNTDTNQTFSAQLSELANRFEETRRDMSAPALQKLERQIAELTTLVSRPDPRQPISELEERIGARIENLTASNDDYIIEAAQHAAEQALQNFEQRRKGEADEHIAVIKALAADLKNLQQAEHKSDGTADLHNTLKTIAGRLEALKTEDADHTPKQDQERVEPGPFVSPEPLATKVETTEPVETETQDLSPFEVRFPAAAPKPASTSAGDAQTDNGVSASDDVMDIISRVRSSQAPAPKPMAASVDVQPIENTQSTTREPGSPAGRRNLGFPGSGPQGDLIAAARRAARSALENAEDMTPSVSSAKSVEETDDGEDKARNAFSRRPVYLAAGAILLAIIAYPLFSDTGRDRDAVLQVGKSFEKTPPSLSARAKTDPPQPFNSDTSVPRTVAEAPSLRAPDRAVVKSNFAAEAREIAAAPAVQAFQMIDTDNSIVTGSIEPDTPASGARIENPAPVKEPVFAVQPPAATRPPKLPVETASVTTEDVLDLLSKPPVKKRTDQTNEPAKQVDKADSTPTTVTPSEQIDASAAGPVKPAPLNITVPDVIKPAALADAARNGNADALYEIGMRYQEGLGLKRDPAQAAIWFDEAAESGSAPAAFQLGSLYEKGTGVEQNAAKAIMLYRAAAKAGNVSAMHNLAVMLANGAGNSEPDLTEAAKWFTAAAEHGVADSQFNLAILYARGAGVAADLAQSYKWFAIAAFNGDPEAAKRRDEVTEALSDADLKRGRKLASDWEAKMPEPAANRVATPAEWLPEEAVASAPDKRAIIRDIQSLLNERGFDAGPEDGLLGAKTDAAIKTFQAKNGLAADGTITPQLVETLLNSNNA